MTRVNIVPVEDLMDQHLVAEYRELPMVPAALNRTLKSKAGFKLSRVSQSYILNSGHVYFFYNKGKFLSRRYDMLVEEMKKRGMNPDPSRKFPVDIFKDNGLYGDYNSTEREVNINRARIEERISAKPKWYRKTAYKV